MASVHFLNVGAGDCTIIEHDSGNLTMIDINNGEDLSDREIRELISGRTDEDMLLARVQLSTLTGIRRVEALKSLGLDVHMTNPIKFLHEKYPGRPIFRYIQSHPDLDHMRGLAALVSSGIKIYNFWDCPHDKEPVFRDGTDKEDWQAYLNLSTGRHGATVLAPKRGSTQKYYNLNEDGSVGGDSLSILSPTGDLHASCQEREDTNNSSYVLKFSSFGINVIFGGDAEEAAWQEIFAMYGESVLPSCRVLKASHHGRDSGYFQMAVKAMSPEYVVVSAGKKPGTEVGHKYAQYCPNVWTTRWMGNIHLETKAEGSRIFSDRDA